MAVQPGGKILGFGSAFVSFQGNLSAWLTVVRLLPSSVLDATFGANGIVMTPFNTSFSGNQSQALTGFLQSDGKFVAAGVETVINPTTGTSNANIAIARYSNTPGSPTINNPALKIADFDGDCKADASVFRSGTWFINPSGSPTFNAAQSPQSFYGIQFGLPTDKLAPADYDGDGKTDIAVWRENSGNPDLSYFYIIQSSNNAVRIEQFGRVGDSPVIAGDWDGDNKADVALYRNGTRGAQSYFFYRPSTQPGVSFVSIPWGVAGDKAMRGDFDGDGKLDGAVLRPSNNVWYILQSSNSSIRYENWGLSTDKFVPADYDGDGKTDLAVFRNGVWYIKQSSDAQAVYKYWGTNSDALVPADYDGDGKTDVAVFRNGIYYILQSSNNQPNYLYFGSPGDIPVASAYIQ